MADDSGKSIRVARTNAGEPNLTGLPSQHTQIVGQTVHQYHSASEGLEQIGAVFANFFGSLQHTAETISEGVNVARRAQIEQENAAQKRQAAGDALAGKPMDAGLTGDLDYYDAYRSVTSQRDGFNAAQDFNQFYLKDWLPNNPTGDLMKARQEWAVKNLTGSQDADYQGQVLDSFFQQTDSMIPRHQEYALKYQTAKGREALGSAIDAQVASGTMDSAKLADFIEKAKVLDPLNSMEAPATVASALLASAQNHPDQMMAISNLLTQDGTGVNGSSFAKSWPDTYSDFQNKAVSAWNQINTVKDLAAVSDMQDRLRDAKSSDELVKLAADVIQFRQSRGGVSATGELLNQIASKQAAFEKTEGIMKGMDGWMSGDTGSSNPSDVRANWPQWLQSRAGVSNIMQLEVPEAAHAVEGLQGVVPEELKVQLSAALTNTRDVAGQMKALQIINTVGGHTGKAYMGDYLTDTANQLYNNVWAISQTSNEPLEAIVARVNAARDGVKDWSVDWKTITGAADEKTANESVDKIIQDAFTNALGSSGGFFGIGASTPKLPANLKQTVLEAARQDAIMAQASGRGWEAGVQDAIKTITENAEVIPGADGQAYVQLNAKRDSGFENEKGFYEQRVRLGFNVMNPTTGMPVDTVAVYKEQLNALAQHERWVLPHGTTAGISLSPASSQQLISHGLIAVLNDGKPIIYAAGQEVELSPKGGNVGFTFGTPVGPISSNISTETAGGKVKLPDTEAGMEELFGDRMPEGFKFLRQDTPHGVIWQLAYRPNFGNQAGFTLDQQASRFAKDNGGGW